MTINIAQKDLLTEDAIGRDPVKIAAVQGQIQQNFALRTGLPTAIRIGVKIGITAEKRMKRGTVEKRMIVIGQKSMTTGLRNMIRRQRGVVPVRRTVLETTGAIENEEDRVLRTGKDRLAEKESDPTVENDLEDLEAEIEDDQIVEIDEEVEVHEEMIIEEDHDQTVKIKM